MNFSPEKKNQFLVTIIYELYIYFCITKNLYIELLQNVISIEINYYYQQIFLDFLSNEKIKYIFIFAYSNF